MANHKSSKTRIRNSERKRVRNRYQKVTERNSIKALKELKDKKEAAEMLKKVVTMIDRLAKKNILHKNKASNLKSQLAKHVNTL